MTSICECTAGGCRGHRRSSYAHHVLHGTASFEETPPSVQFWRDKIEMIGSQPWPFLVACDGSEVVAFAYATQFRDRPAYAFTCENSIYVHPDRLVAASGGPCSMSSSKLPDTPASGR